MFPSKKSRFQVNYVSKLTYDPIFNHFRIKIGKHLNFKNFPLEWPNLKLWMGFPGSIIFFHNEADEG